VRRCVVCAVRGHRTVHCLEQLLLPALAYKLLLLNWRTLPVSNGALTPRQQQQLIG